MERSNRPKAKILQRNSLVVEMGGLQAASGAVWDVPRFLQEAATEKIAPNIVPQLQDLQSDPESLVNLKLELAATIEVAEHFVKATYFLKGDGLLVFSCYEKLKGVAEACQAPYFPNVREVVAAIVKIRIREQRPCNREPRLAYSQRFSGFYGSLMWIFTMQLRPSKLQE